MLRLSIFLLIIISIHLIKNNKAKAQVAEVVANGKTEYTAPMYNEFRDATDPCLGRTHCGDVDNYVVILYFDNMAIEPMV